MSRDYHPIEPENKLTRQSLKPMTDYQKQIDEVLDIIMDSKISKGYHGLPDVIIQNQNDSVDFKRKYAHKHLTAIITKSNIDELEKVYENIDTGNVYLALHKITDRINELKTNRGIE